MAGGMADAEVRNQLNTLAQVGVVGDLSDGLLLQRVVSDEAGPAQAAFSVLVKRHGPMVRGICRQALGDSHDAEDAFQATFLVLARKAGSVRKAESVASWLHGVALRIAVRARAEAARRRVYEREGAAMKAAEREHRADRPESWPELHEEVARLPERYREPVVLCYLEGLSTQAAASRLGCAQGTILSRLSRARERLRTRLIRRGIAAPVALLMAGPAAEAAPEPTVRASLQFAASQSPSAALASTGAVALARGALNAMTISKIKALGAAALTCLLALGSVQAFAWQTARTRAATKEQAGKTPANVDAALAAAPPAKAQGTPGESLVTLSVVDDESGKPIERFRVVPGTPYSGSSDRSVAAWQPHLVRESADGQYEWPKARTYETFRLRIEADGYRISSTAWLREAEGPQTVTIRMRRDAGLQGVILSPDGTPARGATLGIALPNRELRLNGSTIAGADEPPAANPADRWRQPISTRADAQGRFRLPAETDPAALLVVVHEAGYLERPFTGLLDDRAKQRAPLPLRLAPWGRISGRLFWGGRPAAGEPIELIVSRNTLYPSMISASGLVPSDAEGRFEFKAVPPGRAQLACLGPAPDGKADARFQFPVMHVDVRADDATEVVLGGRGRIVTGRLTGLDSYDGVTLCVHPTAPHIGMPGDDEQWAGWAALRNGPHGPIVFRDTIPVAEDGTYRIEGLPPESYQLMVNDSGKGLRGGTEFTLRPATAGDGEQDLQEIRVSRQTP